MRLIRRENGRGEALMVRCCMVCVCVERSLVLRGTEVPGCTVYMSTVVAKVTANTNVC